MELFSEVFKNENLGEKESVSLDKIIWGKIQVLAIFFFDLHIILKGKSKSSDS